jgi:hypothetical protein
MSTKKSGPEDQSELYAKGLLPLRWASTLDRLRKVGIVVESHWCIPSRRLAHAGIGGQDTSNSLWAPRWAVLIAEADPCNDEARDQALTRARRDSHFLEAVDALAQLLDDHGNRRARMADFIMETWEPEDT